MMNHSVDLLISMYERTYRKVLVPGFFPAIEKQNCRSFANRIAIINNVNSRDDATSRAELLLASGEIDRYFFVSDHIDQALAKTGLTQDDLEPVANYTNWAIAGICVTPSPWFIIWDSEIWMNEPRNWIDPSIEFMEENSNVLTSSPNHHPEWIKSSIRKGNFQLIGDFALGYHFSDQVFLARTEQFARPIYNEKCIASLRYPLAHLGSIFEMRIDSYMRNHRLKKAIFIPAAYNHQEETIGLGYPQGLTRIAKLKMIRNVYIHRKLRDRPICSLLRLIGKEHLIV